MAVRSWDELRLLRLARRVFTVVKKKISVSLSSSLREGGMIPGPRLFTAVYVPLWFVR